MAWARSPASHGVSAHQSEFQRVAEKFYSPRSPKTEKSTVIVPAIYKGWPTTSSETLPVNTRTASPEKRLRCTRWMRPVDGQYQPRTLISGVLPSSASMPRQLAAPGLPAALGLDDELRHIAVGLQGPRGVGQVGRVFGESAAGGEECGGRDGRCEDRFHDACSLDSVEVVADETDRRRVAQHRRPVGEDRFSPCRANPQRYPIRAAVLPNFLPPARALGRTRRSVRHAS